MQLKFVELVHLKTYIKYVQSFLYPPLVHPLSLEQFYSHEMYEISHGHEFIIDSLVKLCFFVVSIYVREWQSTLKPDYLCVVPSSHLLIKRVPVSVILFNVFLFAHLHLNMELLIL